MPVRVPARVPKGMDLPGSRKSPDRPTPAVMPVNAGKIMANMMKKPSGTSGPLFGLRSCSPFVSPASGLGVVRSKMDGSCPVPASRMVAMGSKGWVLLYSVSPRKKAASERANVATTT